MAAVRMLFGSLLTIAAFALLLDVTLLMGVLLCTSSKSFLDFYGLGLGFYII